MDCVQPKCWTKLPPYVHAGVCGRCVPTPQMKALCEGYPNMFSELRAETGINEQMVHFVCVLVHRGVNVDGVQPKC